MMIVNLWMGGMGVLEGEKMEVAHTWPPFIPPHLFLSHFSGTLCFVLTSIIYWQECKY